MKDSNKLFIFSIILVMSLLISINYSAIHNFYTYSVPLNNLKIERNVYSGNHTFQEIQNMEGTSCFITPSQNHFCYVKPRMRDGYGISYVIGSNKVDGEMHIDPVSTGVSYFTIKNMTRLNNDDAIITLSDKDYRIGNETITSYKITDKFEYSRIIKKFNSFISHCDNYEGTVVTIVQYLGVTTMDGIDYFMTWHTTATSDHGIKCDYPQIIQYSFEHDFRGL